MDSELTLLNLVPNGVVLAPAPLTQGVAEAQTAGTQLQNVEAANSDLEQGLHGGEESYEMVNGGDGINVA